MNEDNAINRVLVFPVDKNINDIYYTADNSEKFLYAPYARILIKKKTGFCKQKRYMMNFHISFCLNDCNTLFIYGSFCLARTFESISIYIYFKFFGARILTSAPHLNRCQSISYSPDALNFTVTVPSSFCFTFWVE